MDLDTAQQWGASLGVIVAAIAVFEGIRRAIVMPTVRGIRTISRFLADFFGEDARPGVERRPGVMELLRELRDEQAEMKLKLIRVEYHTGNGQEPALRTEVFEQGRAIIEQGKAINAIHEQLEAQDKRE